MNKIVKLSLILFLVSAIVAGVLGLTNMLTEDAIAEYNENKTNEAYAAVMDFSSREEVQYSGGRTEVKKLYKTDTGNYIAECEVSGSQGMITVAVGVNSDLTCNGISIISSSETSGLGAKASEAEFKDQFQGKTAEQALITKDKGEINAITGATITSRAVCTAVGAAIEAVGSVA